MKRLKETARQALTTPKGRLRPEVAVPVVAGMLVIAAGAVVLKSVLDRKGARANKAPKPHYVTLPFSPLDEIDRELGGYSDWAVARRLAPGQKRPRRQVLVVAAEAKDVGIDPTNPHGATSNPALAIRSDKGLWMVARLPEELTVAKEDGDDPRFVVGVALGRQNGLVACLGRLTDRDFFVGVPSLVHPIDQTMDARHFAESYGGVIVRS